MCFLCCVLTREARGVQMPRGPSLPTPEQLVQSRALALCPGRGSECSGARLWPLSQAPTRIPCDTRCHTHGWLRALFKRLCLPGSEHRQAGQRQDAVHLQHRRAGDGEADGPRGAAAGLPPAGQQVGQGPVPGAGGHRGAGAGIRSRGPAEPSRMWAEPHGYLLFMSPN